MAIYINSVFLIFVAGVSQFSVRLLLSLFLMNIYIYILPLPLSPADSRHILADPFLTIDINTALSSQHERFCHTKNIYCHNDDVDGDDDESLNGRRRSSRIHGT